MAEAQTGYSTSAHITNKDAQPVLNAFTNSSRSSIATDSPVHSDLDASTRARDEVTSKRISRRRREKNRRQKQPGVWKKILWVKQSYPDNYTDHPTFLSHLQWNPRVVPYDFWPLVADSTVIVQHVCSVVIFICCFIGIYQEKVSPLSVVGWGSTCTIICWLFWDGWISLEERYASNASHTKEQPQQYGLGLTVSGTATMSRRPSRSPSPNPSPISTAGLPSSFAPSYSQTQLTPHNSPTANLSRRWQARAATVKSAVLIYAALLALSPILKSLTKSTTSDSIWAMSSWLLLLNVFFYDYSGGNSSNDNSNEHTPTSDPSVASATSPPTVIATGGNSNTTSGGAKYQSSLSTNAALMASTVLASRLTTSTHVFSLTLFSIEVFGLFPVFRRYLRSRSSILHLLLTILLITASGAGLGLVLANPASSTSSSTDMLTDETRWGLLRNWKAALAGAVLWSLGNILAMGACSWWLISLQKYKNVVIGPWDPAKPIVRSAVVGG